MGEQNPGPRAHEQRRATRTLGRQGTRGSTATSPGDDVGLAQIQAEVLRAALASTWALEVLLDRFEHAAAPYGPDVVPAMLAERLGTQLHELWHRGWQPSDLRCLLRKQDERTHQLLELAIVDQMDQRAGRVPPPSWARQLAEIADRLRRAGWAAEHPDPGSWLGGHPDRSAAGRRAALRSGATLVAVLLTAPAITLIDPPPCDWPVRSDQAPPPRAGTRRSTADPASIDPSLLAKVRALLAKAESTTFEAEAMALTAKAQSLIAKHSIDAALLDADGGGPSEGPRCRRLPVEDPYAQAKALLLSAIAQANRATAVWSKDLGFATTIGFDGDLDGVELLYTSLLVQASAAMRSAGSRQDHFGRSTTRSFRRSFLVGYADRIAQRLRSASAETVDDRHAETGRRLLPVLAARDEQVDAAVAAAFPRTVDVAARAGNAEGFVAGQIAADRARLGPGTSLPR